jgi:hypothetical protein
MKLKMIGLAAVAAMALLAFAGNASAKVCSGAGATEFCGGSHGFIYDGTIHATLKTGTSATLTTTNAEGKTVSTVTCTTSTVHGTITGTTGAGSISNFTFSNCSSATCPNGVTATTTASAGNQWPAQATTGAAPNGTLAVEKVQGQFICGSFLGNITCVYNTAKATTNVVGGEPAHVTAINVPLNLVSGNTTICGTKADWSGTYVITTPKNLYLT